MHGVTEGVRQGDYVSSHPELNDCASVARSSRINDPSTQAVQSFALPLFFDFRH